MRSFPFTPFLTIFAALAALALASSAVAREEGNSRSVAGSRVAGNGSTGHRDMRDGAGGRVRIHSRTLTLSHVYLARRDTSEVRIQRGRRRRRAAVLDEGGLRRQQTALRANILQLGNVENRDTVFPWDQKPNYDLPGVCLPCASRNKLTLEENFRGASRWLAYFSTVKQFHLRGAPSSSSPALLMRWFTRRSKLPRPGDPRFQPVASRCVSACSARW